MKILVHVNFLHLKEIGLLLLDRTNSATLSCLWHMLIQCPCAQDAVVCVLRSEIAGV